MSEISEIKMKYSSVGIEYDSMGIRAVKLQRGDKGEFQIIEAYEVSGDFSKDEDLEKGFKELKSKLALSPKTTVVTCLSGKQIHTTQLAFKLLPPEKMTSALKIKIRKTVPFEVAGAIIDYQVLTKAQEKTGESELLVSVASKILLNKHLKDLDKQGIKPDVVDIQPLVIANALLAKNNDSKQSGPMAIVHIAPSLCTIIITGNDCPFFHRTIPFSGLDLFTEGNNEVPERERERRLKGLADEITRSVSFYDKNFRKHLFNKVFVTGNFIENDGFINAIRDQVEFEIEILSLSNNAVPSSKQLDAYYDLAIATALRCAPSGEKNSFAYTTNLVADLRTQEKKKDLQRVWAIAFTGVCIAILVFALFATALKVVTMKSTLNAEQQKLDQLEQEYNNYAKAQLIVNKADVEMLDTLQGTRIFWTKKLASMAFHLPDNYWISEFKFDAKEFNVSGYGYISPNQGQLISIDEYLNLMRKDTLFNDDFKNTFLDVTEREDEGNRERVNFKYSAVSSRPNSGNVTRRNR